MALAVSKLCLYFIAGKNWFIEKLIIYPRSEICRDSRELYNILLFAEIIHFNNGPVLKSGIYEFFVF